MRKERLLIVLVVYDPLAQVVRDHLHWIHNIIQRNLLILRERHRRIIPREDDVTLTGAFAFTLLLLVLGIYVFCLVCIFWLFLVWHSFALLMFMDTMEVLGF